MKIGDIVRLKQPFRPQLNNPKKYYFGIITGLVQDRSEGKEQITGLTPNEILVHLYDPDMSTIFTDEMGVEAIFAFHRSEVIVE